MRRSHFTQSITTTFIGILVLLLGATVAVAQQQVNLAAGSTSLTLPDGSSVPMWGYTCSVSGTVAAGTAAQTCNSLNPASTGWSPIVITVPLGQTLQVNLTNNLVFGANNIPTSLVIVGQLGGGLGGAPSRTTSPAHENLSTTWPIANTGPVFVPPSQPDRVQSFATEVAGGTSTTNALTWSALRPGTYLLESGTHPSIQGPMGLYGIVVVTTAPSGATLGTAYTGVSYGADVPLLLSEIDPVQNKSVTTAVNTAGFSETATLGPYSAQPLASLNLLNPGHGYTQATTTVQLSGGGCSTSSCAASVAPVVDSDPSSSTYQQITGFTIASGGSYTSAPQVTVVGNCTVTPGNPCASADAALQLATSSTCSGGAAKCYPPAVNYTPLYYLINGQAFDKTSSAKSLFAAAPATGVTGSVLVRIVNAGLRMHVPAIVGAQTGASSVSGFALIAEDGNKLPGVPRVQSEVFMAAGKTYDVMINAPATVGTALPIYDRELSLSANSTNRDAGMLAYIGINGATVPSTLAGLGAPVARADSYQVVPGKTLAVSDLAKSVIANDTNVFGVQLGTTTASNGTVTLNSNGTFTYVPTGWTSSTTDSFNYCANGSTTVCATVSLTAATVEAMGGIVCVNPSYTASNTKHIAIGTPGVLSGCTDAAGYPLTVDTATVTPATGLSVVADVNGGFAATGSGGTAYTFTFQPVNSQGTHGALVTATVTFPAGSGLAVTVLDGADHKTTIGDYRWIIEEDRTFYVDPNCTTNPLPAGCPTVTSQGAPAVFGTNFHTSFMPVVASGCTGALSCESGQTVGGAAVVCDVGNGACRAGSQQTAVDPSQVQLDPKKRYYISILPGDAANPFNAGYAGAPDCSTAGVAAGSCGHGMGGAPIAAGQTAVTIFTQPSPYPPAKLTVFVFEDDFPLNGEHDAGGGVDVLSPLEPGLGGFQITLFDDAGGTGDATGQPTYDMFNMPLTNSLAGTVDPITQLDACPISTQATASTTTGDGSQKGIVGMIVTCPMYESDGVTMSPLAGQAVVNNLYQGRYGVMATPAADRIARGEEWLQTNTLDGQKAHDSFMRIGEPAYFQEFGPAGYHVTIGFANPKIINDRKTNGSSGLCDAAPNGGGLACNNEVKGHNTMARMSRPPDERLYGSGSRDSFAFTQCYASLGDPDGADFAFTKCDDQGNFDFKNIPAGNWKLTLFDQWNDQIVDGISTPVGLAGQSQVTLDLGEVATHQWQANIYTRSFIDTNRDGVSNKDSGGNDLEGGLALVSTNIRFRDGSYSNFNNTDLNGYAGFNEVFPLFNWYTIETDSTRYKTTGVHVVYDAGGPTDGTTGGGTSNIAQFYANTTEAVPLPSTPTNLRVPGAVYCANADCTGSSIATGPVVGGSSGPDCTWNSDGTVSCSLSTGRIDPPTWFGSYGWQGFSGQSSFLEFGKAPYADTENGGIRGHVIYASTRPFDDPRLLLQLSWEPMVPHVRINLYQETTAGDGTQGLQLVDFTETSSFDDWAQGFRSDGVPNMNCPGQTASDLFFFGLQNQPNYIDYYNNVLHGTATSTITQLPYMSQFKCYDGMHNWNQLQPAPYDGMYSFPSVTSFNPKSGKPATTNCTGCTTNPDASDTYRFGTPMLKPGKYVVEVVVPPGYELVKEEDKNILIGDNYIAPVTQQFAGLGNVFILPDQAAIDGTFNANNAQNATTDLGRTTFPSTEGDTGSVEQFWPCVGTARTVPDFISLFPQSQEVAPFAGATRNLCDRKEVTVENQASALAKFYLFTSTHVASHFTGVITDDFTAEFDPFSPQFGEKFAPSYLPVSVKDWAGNEVSRVYSDAFGAYGGLNYSTWEVNPPNPTGYGPTMMVTCMNDAGTGATPDPLFQPNYSQFCYELPFMPGQTGYFDTPVVPTSAFSEGYNHPDCNYPDATPAIASVTSQDIAGPWVAAPNRTLTINALGDQLVDNPGYSGPQVTNPSFNKQKVTRHYGFGTCSLVGGVCTNGASVTIGGRAASITSWSDTQIVVSAPNNVPACAVQQQPPAPQSAKCGQLLITASNGKQSIDTVTVTVGGTKPTLLVAGQTIQSALDAANPGDMIIVPPGTYNEMLIMWKPVRLQGVGAVSSIINANTHPAGKMEPWRQQIVCLFGLTTDGRPRNPTDLSCAGSGWTNLPGANANFPAMVVDRLTMEAVLGWDANFNGNLAEQLIEPSLMGAYEGAAITVVGKGVKIPKGSTDPFGDVGATGSYPAGTTFLTASDCGNSASRNPYPSNFYCNPSSIDGLSLTNSSQGGGGIFVHGWGHNIQIANNRVQNNQGSLSGGITIGQGEHVDVTLAGTAPLDPPGSCENGLIPNQGLPFCFNMNVSVHNNFVTLNSSLGDELFSSTPAGAGGVTFCTGADYYKFNYNWVCGNMSTGDGGGVAHIGFIKNGDIEHNSILFNQSTNPTITTNGGGLLIMGAPDLDPLCAPANNPDLDCVPDPTTVTPSDGTGPGLVVNANLIMGNAADAGSGGGLRLQHVNGTDVINFPNGLIACLNVANGICLWNSVNVTNNIIVNNVAGWDGGGVSLLDSMAVNIVNNTISSNDSTASSGVLFTSLFAPLASAPGTNCTANNGARSCPQVAGLVSDLNSPILQANLPSGLRCPANHGTGSGASATCAKYSDPLLANDVIWQNRSFYIGVTAPTGSGTTGQQSAVALFNSFTGTAAASQSVTGACPTSPAASYWEIGVRGDQGPADHSSGFSFTPTYSVLTNATDYGPSSTTHNLGSNPALISQYCNGSRVPPELGNMGYTVNPGTNETNALPAPVFSLTPSATVDEGNNWINLRWGPLSLTHPVSGAVLGNYAPAAGSPVINQVPPGNASYTAAPTSDFFGNPRKTVAAGNVDIGAVEVQGVSAPTLTSVTPNAGFRGDSYNVALVGSGFATGMTINFSGTGLSSSNLVVTSATAATATFTIAPAASSVGSHNVTVTVPGNGTSNAVTFTVSTPPTPTLTSIVPNTGAVGTNVPVTLNGTNFTTNGTTVNFTSGVGINVTGVTVVSSTQITATFQITSGAGTGTHNVRVTTPGGNSGSLPFTVTGPTLTSISPASAARGTTVNVTVTGTLLTGATSVAVSGSGVSVSNFVAVNATTVTATFTIASNAPSGGGSGLRTVTVSTPSGNATINFRVTAATLGFSGPVPALTTATANTSTKTGLVTVNNTATGTTAGPFTFTAAPAITKVGAPGGTFSIIAGGTCANGLTLAPAASCTINVQYAPGTSTATATANVTATGTGTNPAATTSGNFTAN